ncbi:hypothetical protein BS47DRAFT_1329372 [Hydnum rufescens UP504]|uniref:Threonine/serine exporter-like N-terminal domain-containing protein n=1 Tax=Hydnum rufescens UP504 TaxID=1448309 RepID=A0A9P6AX71_9AGAM|nr:hypothetical protein BS47DRAFT_1329372 [Hydnum rufescens UP504]
MSKADNVIEGPQDHTGADASADHFGGLLEASNPVSNRELNTLDDPLGKNPAIGEWKLAWITLNSTNVTPIAQRYRRQFIVVLCRSFLAYGWPTHRIEAQLTDVAECLGVKAEFSLLPTVIFAFFGDHTGRGSAMHVIKEPGGLSLERLQATRNVLEAVTQNQMSAYVGAKALRTIHEADDTYGRKTKCLFAFLCGFVITLFAFQGAAADALIGGLCAAGMAVLSLYLASENPLIAKIFELLGAFVISFIARALYSNTEHQFCYSAIASGGIVLILPGFTVMSAALEIATKVLLTGSMKIVFAIFRALFLGFVQTLGSDLYLRIDKNAMQQRRSPKWSWPWYFQHPPWWSQLFLVPLFALALSLWNGQQLSWVEKKTVIVMVTCAGAAYAANTIGGQHLTGAIGSTLGALAVGVCGNAYARIFKAPAYVLMVPGVLLLVPTGLTAVGGLSKNYSGGNDQFESGLNTGLAMIKVSIGVSVGLSLANFLIYVQWWKLFCFLGLFKRWKREDEIKQRFQSKALFTF